MTDIYDFPTSPEGAIKIDQICCDLRVAVGKIILALKQLGLRRGDIQEVRGSLRVTLPCGLQSGLIFRNGAGVVDLLPGPQDRFPKEDSRFPLSCFAQSQGAPQPPAFEDRDRKRWPHRE